MEYITDTNFYWESEVDTINSTIDAANWVLEQVSTYCVDTCLRLNEAKSKYMFLGSKPAIKKLNMSQTNAQTLNENFVKNNNATIDPKFTDEKLQNLYPKFTPSIHKFSFQPVTEEKVIKVTKSLKPIFLKNYLPVMKNSTSFVS